MAHRPYSVEKITVSLRDLIFASAGICILVFAWPSAAVACVNSCGPGATLVNGGIGIDQNGFAFCTANGQPLCTSGGGGSPSSSGTVFRRGSATFTFTDAGARTSATVGGTLTGEMTPASSAYQGGTFTSSSQYADERIKRGPFEAGNNPVGFTAYRTPTTAIEVFGTGYSSRQSAVATDQATGLVSLQPRVTDKDAGIGARIRSDLSGTLALPKNQSVVLTAGFEQHWASMDYGAGVGSGHRDLSIFTFGAGYSVERTYLIGTGILGFGTDRIDDAASGGKGSSRLNVADVRVDLGHSFMLWGIPTNSEPASPRGPMVTKAPGRVTSMDTIGWAATFLDVSGHFEHTHGHFGSIVENNGSVIGEENADTSRVGVSGRLVWQYLGAGLITQPYVGLSYDRIFRYSDQLSLPAASNTISFDVARDVGRLEAGVSVLSAGRFSVGLNGFYAFANDLNAVGGTISILVPLRWQ